MKPVRKLWSDHTTPILLVAAVGVIAALGTFGDRALQLATISMLIYVLLVVGLYIFLGNSGVFSFGHIGFMAIGAYTAAAFRIPSETKSVLFPQLPDIQLDSVTATVLGGAAAAIVALLIAIPLMRLSGIAASIGTFAFLNIVFVLASNLDHVTGGSTGLAGVPRTTGISAAFLWAAGAIIVAWLYQRTANCLRLRGSREDDTAARAVGINIPLERTMAFCLSAFVTGVGGALFAQVFGTFNPSAFFVAITFETVAMLVVGGRISLSGAVIGALFLSLLGDGLRNLETGFSIGPVTLPNMVGLQQVAIALAMLVVLLLRPSGITGGREVTGRVLRDGLARMAVVARSRRAPEPRPRPAHQPAVRQASSAESPTGTRQPGLEPTPGRVEGPDKRDHDRILTVSDLTVAYDNIIALQHVGFEVLRGEVVGLIGPNGAGKSTTLRTIAGFLRPSTGAVEFDGKSLVGLAPERIVRRDVAFVPEGREILGTLSVAENLRLGAIAAKDPAAVAARTEEALDLFPALKRYYRSSAGHLSGGEQQMLAIARALMSGPRLLLLDEPSLGLAPLAVEVVYDVLTRLRESGVTILLVEQNVSAAVEFADRSYIMRTGRIVSAGTRAHLLATTDFANTYLGED